MSRITDRILVQRVDDEMVMLDEVTAAEVTFPVAATPNVVAAMTYLADPEGVGDLDDVTTAAMSEDDLKAIELLLRYIRSKGYDPKLLLDGPSDPSDLSGPYDKTRRTTANLDEAINKLSRRIRA